MDQGLAGQVIRVCFHGAESTGKSVLAQKLAAAFGCPLVPEYGREYAETFGTDFTLDALLAIAREQDRRMRIACAGAPALVLLDTDPLMTAAWARMLFGAVPAELTAFAKAELYLLFAPDVPWIADGTRFFGTAETRAAFARAAEDVLVETGVRYATVGGAWAERERQARAAIAAAIS